MPSCVDHQSSPEIHRAVLDLDGVIFDPYFSIFQLGKQLRIGLKGPQKTNVIVSLQGPFVFVLDQDGVVLMFLLGCDKLAPVGDIDGEFCFSLPGLLALKDLDQVIADNLLNVDLVTGMDYIGHIARRLNDVLAIFIIGVVEGSWPEEVCV